MAEMTDYGNSENVVAPGGLTELVRGQDQDFLARIHPLVRQEDVVLDLNGVERIDAAGMAALIRLYCDASQAGHKFTVTRPERHVLEILDLVGLDRFLIGEHSGGDRLVARLHKAELSRDRQPFD